MRNVGSLVVLLALVAGGCEGPHRSVVLGPTPLAPTASPSPPLPAPVPHPRLAEAIPLAVGQAITSQTTTDDPLCTPDWPHRCRYFKITAPEKGTLHVTMRWSEAQRDPYPLDIGVIGPNGVEWSADVGPGTQRRVQVEVDADATYVVEIWSFLTPAEPFELTSSLEPR